MGRGPRTSEIRVEKKRQEYPRGSIAESAGAPAETVEADECLFNVKATVVVSETEASGIRESSPVVIVPHHTDTKRLELFVENRSIGIYAGPNAEKMLSCIQKGYVYEGAVKSVSNTADGIMITYKLEGRGM